MKVLVLRCGLVAGGIVLGVAAGYLLPGWLNPPPDWTQMAEANTMPGRRVYTLPLNNPDMIPATQATYMRDTDIVLGVVIHGQARAYPWWLVSNYHVVNDTVEQEPLLITLCEICGGACAFRPVLPELPELALSFQICGIRSGTIEIADQQTLSHWHPFLGTAVEGPLKGRTLDNYPLVLMTWNEWRSLYPASVVVNGSPQLRERPHGAESGRIGDPDIPPNFLRGINFSDTRLGLHELVVGIKMPEAQRSYAVPSNKLVPFPNLFLVSAGTNSVLIVRQTELAMTAFDLHSLGNSTNFSLLSKTPIQFRTPDGLIWSAFGICTTPGKYETRLPSAHSYLTEWYEWVSHSPDCEIIGSARITPLEKANGR